MKRKPKKNHVRSVAARMLIRDLERVNRDLWEAMTLVNRAIASLRKYAP